MFQDVPECSGMFHVPGFIDGQLKHLEVSERSLRWFRWAYGKSGNPDPESETGTGIRQINECFKLGSMTDINTPPPFSPFLARWMMICGD